MGIFFFCILKVFFSAQRRRCDFGLKNLEKFWVQDMVGTLFF